MSDTVRRIHFVAIGGTGMGSLAALLHARGQVHRVAEGHVLLPCRNANVAHDDQTRMNPDSDAQWKLGENGKLALESGV